MLFCSIFNLMVYFKKKLMALLFLEMSFISLIFLYFFYGFLSFGVGSTVIMMLFLGFLVLDSVLGLCLLVVSSRNSTSFLDSFFGC